MTDKTKETPETEINSKHRMLIWCGRALIAFSGISLLTCLVILAYASYELVQGTDRLPRRIVKNSVTHRPPIPGYKSPFAGLTKQDNPVPVLKFLIAEKLILIFLNTLVIAGSYCMLRFRHYRISQLAAMISFVPCCGAVAGFPLGAFCGIAALILMQKAELKKAFY